MTTDTTDAERIEAAIEAAQWLAGQGFGIVEAYAPSADGCSCRAGAECESPGKHPVGSDWQKRATRSPLEIERRVRRRDGQYGVMPWPREGGLILDIDHADRLPVELPSSYRVVSRPGRGHAYFRLPAGVDPGALPATAAWGEVRVEGASRHVIGPHSRHAGGTVYTPHGDTIAELPADLIDRLLPAPDRHLAAPGEPISEDRNINLTSLAGKMRRQGFGGEAVLAALRAENKTRVKPPLTDREVRRIAESVARYEPKPDIDILSAEGHVRSGGKQPLAFLSARDLAAETPAETPWRVAGLLADGALTELDGRPKTAGKSTFGAHLIGAVLDGRPFLGRQTVRSAVVLLSEQPPASLRGTLAAAEVLDRDDLHLLLLRAARGAEWPAIVAAAVAECRRTGARVLAIDTLPQWAGLRGDSENDSGAALEAVRPLQDAAADGLAVLLMRHDRKGGGDVGESARGSSAFTGAVDIVLRLSRRPDALRPTIRELAALSRFEGWPESEMIELTAEGYISLGDGLAVALTAAREALLDGLPAAEPGLTLDEIVPDLVERRTTAQAALRDLVTEDRVTRAGKGRKGDPYRYLLNDPPFVPEFLSAAPMVAANRKRIPPEQNGADLTAAALSVFGDVLVEPAVPTDTSAMVPRPTSDA